MEGPMPGWLAGIRARISRQQRWAFAGVWAAGLFAHGYMLANKLPNHDDIACFWSKGGSIELGRWGLGLVEWLDGGFSSPWLLGLLSLLFISLAAMLLVELLRLQSPLFCFLAGSIVVCFPSVISAFAYMFTSDAYMLAFFLTVLAVSLSVRGGWRRLAAVACLVLSLGLYQGFLGWAIALMMYTLLARCLEEDADLRRIFTDGLWDVGVLAAGVAGYIGLTRLIWAVTGVAPSTQYQGVDQLGRLDLQALPGQFREAYSLVLNTFRSPSAGACTMFRLRVLLTACLWFAVLLAAARIACQFRRGRRPEALLALVLLLGMPAGINVACLMNSAYVHTLMIYPMCMIPLGALAQCEAWNARLPRCKRPAGRRLHTLGRWACAGLAALLASQYALQANEAYLCLQINHTRRVSYWTSVVTRIKSLPGYDQWMPVVLITKNAWDRSTPSVWDNMDHFNDLVGIRMPMNVYSDAAFLNEYLGFVTEFLDPADYKDLEEVQNMPTYPLDGSVRLIDGVIVVKFSDG